MFNKCLKISSKKKVDKKTLIICFRKKSKNGTDGVIIYVIRQPSWVLFDFLGRNLTDIQVSNFNIFIFI